MKTSRTQILTTKDARRQSKSLARDLTQTDELSKREPVLVSNEVRGLREQEELWLYASLVGTHNSSELKPHCTALASATSVAVDT